ncbi:MAG TPA: hypothetical protein PKE47_06170 [Verrucomicrobiota bacterium]|nr:hypothetical protein [Verrucomicrobiota bacterium]
MPKPNPEEFAKGVLWHLTSLRAEVYEVQCFVVSLLVAQTGQAVDEIKKMYDKDRTEMQERFYREACEDAGIQDDLPPSGQA